MFFSIAAQALMFVTAVGGAVSTPNPAPSNNLRGLSKGGNGKGRGDGNGSVKHKLNGDGCTILEKVPLNCVGRDGQPFDECPPEPMDPVYSCELSDGRIYEIDNDTSGGVEGIQNVAKGANVPAGRFISNGEMFTGDADIDETTATIKFNSGRIDTKPIGGRGRGKGHGNRQLEKIGDKTVLVVKVSADNKATSHSADQLANSVFGALVGMSDKVNLASQYSDCSSDRLNFGPLPDRNRYYATSGVSNIKNGLVSVTGLSSADGSLYNQVTTKLTQAFRHKYAGADYIMMCMPPGFLNVAAYAYVNAEGSVYDDKWCTYPSAQMHEVGHNLGLAHSGEGGSSYGDTIGFMGSSSAINEHEMCFNGPHAYQLGWFPDRHVELSAEDIAWGQRWSGRLYGQTKYAGTTSNRKMIIRISPGDHSRCSSCDLYVSFNHAYGMNSMTGEAKNQVVVHAKYGSPSSYSKTWIKKKMGRWGSYVGSVDGRQVKIVVTSIDAYEGWAHVIVRKTYGAPVNPWRPITGP